MLDAGLEVAGSKGVNIVRPEDIAEMVGCSKGLVFYHFKNIETRQSESIRHACETLEHSVIAQAMALRYSLPHDLHDCEKIKAAELLIERYVNV